jgi:hypothetical protein
VGFVPHPDCFKGTPSDIIPATLNPTLACLQNLLGVTYRTEGSPAPMSGTRPRGSLTSLLRYWAQLTWIPVQTLRSECLLGSISPKQTMDWKRPGKGRSISIPLTAAQRNGLSTFASIWNLEPSQKQSFWSPSHRLAAKGQDS